MYFSVGKNFSQDIFIILSNICSFNVALHSNIVLQVFSLPEDLGMFLCQSVEKGTQKT